MYTLGISFCILYVFLPDHHQRTGTTTLSVGLSGDFHLLKILCGVSWSAADFCANADHAGEYWDLGSLCPQTVCLSALLMAQKPSVFKGRKAVWYFRMKGRKKWLSSCCDCKAVFHHLFEIISMVHKLALSSSFLQIVVEGNTSIFWWLILLNTSLI